VLIARAFRVPVVIHIHGGGFPRYLRRFRGAKLSVLNRCAAIVVVNDHLRDMFGDHPCSARVRVLYNMLPDRTGDERLPQDNNGTTPPVRILYLGRFDPLKGCLELLEAFRTIRSTRCDAHLIMAGEGRQWQAARRFIEEHHLQDAVELLGWVEGDAKERLLDAADVMALPSSVEAFPMVILEAMQRAMPVVTVNRPGVEAQVVNRETGIIAPTPAPEHLAAALLTLIEDAQLRRQYGEAGRRRFLERFTSEVIGPELAEIYRACASGTRPSAPADRPARPADEPAALVPTGASICDDFS
jgi:glycosyltransferase involved in cell wall biosynthesis